MKVKELIQELQDFDGDMEVHIEYNYGDHWNTQVAPGVTEVAEESVVHSDYHQMGQIAKDDDDGPDDILVDNGPANRAVVIIRA